MKKILALLLFASVCSAANEICITETTGQTDLYVFIQRVSDIKVWDGDSFETTPASWAICKIAIAESGFIPGLYFANIPAVGEGKYRILPFKGAGTANTDTALPAFYYDADSTGEEKTFANVDVGSLSTQAKLDINTEADTAITDAALAKTSELASVKLAADGLDNITNSEPAVWPPQTLKDTISAIYRWYFNKKTATTTEIRLYGDDGETVIMTKPVNYDGVTKTVGKPE